MGNKMLNNRLKCEKKTLQEKITKHKDKYYNENGATKNSNLNVDVGWWVGQVTTKCKSKTSIAICNWHVT